MLNPNSIGGYNSMAYLFEILTNRLLCCIIMIILDSKKEEDIYGENIQIKY